MLVLCDRGFADQKLYALMRQLGFGFIVRMRRNIVVTAPGGEERAAGDRVPENGRAKLVRNAKVMRDGYEVGAVVCVKQKGMKEAWCLAASSTTALAILRGCLRQTHPPPCQRLCGPRRGRESDRGPRDESSSRRPYCRLPGPRTRPPHLQGTIQRQNPMQWHRRRQRWICRWSQPRERTVTNTRHKKRTIKIMADYYCFPLWLEGSGDIDPRTLDLSQSTATALLEWADKYNETLDKDNPLASGFRSEPEADWFEKEGRRLWRLVQDEIGSQFNIVYFSEHDQKIVKGMSGKQDK